MKTEILKLLKETEGHVSGQEICERFGVSRTAVWKVINQLKEEGYQIEAVRNKGYHLEGISDVLSKEELESSMDTEWAGCAAEYFDKVDSTNTKAKELAERGAVHGTLVVADDQTMGKGRRGRSWTSFPGSGVWMSIVLRPQIPPVCASMLTLVCALAVVKGVESETGLEVGIKWPNDIVVSGKKICGILTEMSTEVDYINYVVAGIGINVNIEEFPEEISKVATSLNIESGNKFLRSRLITSTMRAFEEYYSAFISCKDMTGLLCEYNKKLVNKDQFVKVLAPGHEYTGVSLGINGKGELLVKTEDGSVQNVLSGEVSVRGVYGYV